VYKSKAQHLEHSFDKLFLDSILSLTTYKILTAGKERQYDCHMPRITKSQNILPKYMLQSTKVNTGVIKQKTTW
jgi:hypothetical protein